MDAKADTEEPELRLPPMYPKPSIEIVDIFTEDYGSIDYLI